MKTQINMSSRLRSLELHGYKTFASKTSFEFPGKITAIVGPNGSGKSNVADAIRWVLGEQSYRLLRGRKTEDMIFIGSDMRSRAGMASATITFNNEDNWLPIDFSEVSVTRRAYRDGQNEYLLNGQRIRLRDIQELFAQSGLAERTYTLIGQGLVDTALSARPDERRKFFEEAAGIGLYRSRREESVTRLEQTKRNLERVRDILSELEPRLKSLERQARRFIEYKTIQADLKVLLHEWYGYHWHREQDELSKSKKLLKERELTLANARNEYEKFDHQISGLRKDLQEIRSQLDEWHTGSANLHRERERISKELAVMDERQRSMLLQRQNSESDLMRIEEEEKDRLLMLNSLKIELDQLITEKEEAESQVEKFSSRLAEQKQERMKIEEDVRRQRAVLVQLQTKSVELTARKNEIGERINSLQHNLTKMDLEQKNAQEKLHSAKSEYSSAQLNAGENEEKRTKYEEQIQIINDHLKSLDDKHLKIQKELTNLNSDQARLIAQIDVLDQAEAALTGLNDGAKTIFNASKTGKLVGNYKPLTDFLEIPSQYELALSAALGEYLDSIIILDDSDPESILHLLAVEEKGRVVILPVKQIHPVKGVKMPSKAGVIGNYNNLCKFDSKISTVLNVLLAETIFVENREIAKELLPTLVKNERVITLVGEVFYANGAIVAGKERRSVLITRPRQKRELLDSLEKSRLSLADCQKSMRQIDDEIQENKEKLQVQRNLLQQFDQSSQARLKEIHQSNLIYEQALQKNDWLRVQIENSQKSIDESRKKLDLIQKDLEKNKQEALTQENMVQEASRKLASLPLDDLQAEAMHWQTNLAVSNRAVEGLRKRLQEFEEMLSQASQRKNSLLRRTEDLSFSLDEVEEKKAVLRAQEQDINIKIEELLMQIKPAEENLIQIEFAYSSLQEEQSNAQQGVSIAERYYSQAQLDFSRNKDSLINLQRRIEDDFGLVAFEYSASISGANPLPFEGLVEQLPHVEILDVNLEANISRQRAQIRRIGPINPDADEEFLTVKNRYEFMTSQVEDLKKADEDLRTVIEELDQLMQREFKKTFDAVAVEFREMFTQLFGGGTAKLILTDEENFNNSGIDIEARLPGRREQGLSLLSGGERSLTAVALIFALLKVSPTPFCVLDEVDAALDESNVGRFCELLASLSKQIQFIVITHNRNTVQVADVIYGITMGRDSTSQMISLRLDELNEEMVN